MMAQLVNIMIFIFKEPEINLWIHPQIPCHPPNTSCDQQQQVKHNLSVLIQDTHAKVPGAQAFVPTK